MTSSVLSLPLRNPRRSYWVLAGVIALALHGAILFLPWQKWLPTGALTPPRRMEVVPLTSDQIAALRARRERTLLLQKDLADARDERPRDARYFSDRDRTVEKEQRAERTDAIPRQGVPAAPSAAPDLGRLGVALPQPTGKRKPVAGADQAILDTQLPAGAENVLNTERSVYYSFYSRLYEAIAPVWQSRIRDVTPTRKLPAGEYPTDVIITMDRLGNLRAISYLRRSGVFEFDDAVEYSWRKIRQFPNPPAGLLREDGTVQTTWTFNVSVGPGTVIQYSPPVRR